MNNILKLFGVTALLVTVLSVVGAPAKQPDGKPFTFTCVLFDHKDNQEVLRGHVDPKHFKVWFKEDYDLGGDMGPEIPQNATAFGALVLTDGNDILVMPLYTWKKDKQQFFACRGHEVGRAPMFCVIAKSREAFFQSMKARLKEIGKAEQSPPGDVLKAAPKE